MSATSGGLRFWGVRDWIFRGPKYDHFSPQRGQFNQASFGAVSSQFYQANEPGARVHLFRSSQQDFGNLPKAGVSGAGRSKFYLIIRHWSVRMLF